MVILEMHCKGEMLVCKPDWNENDGILLVDISP